MTNEELARAVERVDGFVQRWEARMGFRAQPGMSEANAPYRVTEGVKP